MANSFQWFSFVESWLVSLVQSHCTYADPKDTVSSRGFRTLTLHQRRQNVAFPIAPIVGESPPVMSKTERCV